VTRCHAQKAATLRSSRQKKERGNKASSKFSENRLEESVSLTLQGVLLLYDRTSPRLEPYEKRKVQR
jgi:hypothetical protein